MLALEVILVCFWFTCEDYGCPGCTVQAQFAIGHMIEPMHTSHAGPAQNSEVGHCLTTGPKLAGAPPGTWKCFC